MTDKNTANDLLKNRFVPNPASNLSARIIAAAARHPKQSFWQILIGELSEMFIVPRPAFALAACLILGLALALQVPIEQATEQTDYFSFLTFDDGGWL